MEYQAYPQLTSTALEREVDADIALDNTRITRGFPRRIGTPGLSQDPPSPYTVEDVKPKMGKRARSRHHPKYRTSYTVPGNIIEYRLVVASRIAGRCFHLNHLPTSPPFPALSPNLLWLMIVINSGSDEE